jgi:Uma2 family endonuclease
MPMRTQEELEQELYPDDDSLPMSDNTLQFEWIVTLQGNLDALFRENPTVFVGGNLLWYAVEGSPEIRTAPDVLVVFGRPKVYRGSYKQWQEDGIAPHVVFEVLSLGNQEDDLSRKFEFYERYGVEEYYLYDPEGVALSGWRRENNALRVIEDKHGWVSPRLGIRFELSGEELVSFRADDERFLTLRELKEEQEREHNRANEAQQRANEAQQRAERLAAQLRALGIEPEA